MIDIQNIDDNEFFKWCLVKYLHPADHHPAGITKAEQDFSKRLDLKDIKFSVKSRDIRKIKKNNSIGINIFGYKNKEKYPTYVAKKKIVKENMLIYY